VVTAISVWITLQLVQDFHGRWWPGRLGGTAAARNRRARHGIDPAIGRVPGVTGTEPSGGSWN